MITWQLMREWAIVRHAIVNGGNPYSWPWHRRCMAGSPARSLSHSFQGRDGNPPAPTFAWPSCGALAGD